MPFRLSYYVQYIVENELEHDTRGICGVKAELIKVLLLPGLKNGNVIAKRRTHIERTELLEFEWCDSLAKGRSRKRKKLVVHTLMSLWCVIKIT